MVKIYKICLILCTICLGAVASNFVLAGNGFFLDKDSKFYIFDNLQINGYLAAISSDSKQAGLIGDLIVGHNLVLDKNKGLIFCKNPTCANDSDKNIIWNSAGVEVNNDYLNQISVKKILAKNLNITVDVDNGKEVTVSSDMKIARCFTNSFPNIQNDPDPGCDDGMIKTKDVYADKIIPRSANRFEVDADGEIKLKDVNFAADFDLNNQNICWSQSPDNTDPADPLFGCGTLLNGDLINGRLGFYDASEQTDWLSPSPVGLTDKLIMQLCTKTEIVTVKKNCDCDGNCSENCGCQISGDLDKVCEGGDCNENCTDADGNPKPDICCPAGEYCTTNLTCSTTTSMACVDACPGTDITCTNSVARNVKCIRKFGTDYNSCRIASFDDNGDPNWRCFKKKEIDTYSDKLCETADECHGGYDKCKEKVTVFPSGSIIYEYYCYDKVNDKYSERDCNLARGDADCIGNCVPVGYDSLHKAKPLFEFKGSTTCCNLDLTY